MLRRKEILLLRPLLNLYGCKRMFHLSYCSLLRGINSDRSKTEYVPNLREKRSVTDVHVYKSNENFYGIEGDLGVIVVEGSSSAKTEELKKQVIERKEVEKLSPASFGTIRCDYENTVKYHGQFENEDRYVLNRKNRASVLKLISVPLKSSEDESKVSGEIIEKYNESQCSRNVSENMMHSQTFENSNIYDHSLENKFEELKNDTENNQSKSFIDQYYFQDSLLKDELSNNEVHSSSDSHKICDSSVSDTITEANFIDKQYFQKPVQNDVSEISYPNFTKGEKLSSDKVKCSKQNNFHSSDNNSEISDGSVGDGNIESHFIEEQYFQPPVQNDACKIDNPTIYNMDMNINLQDSSATKIFNSYTGFNSYNIEEGLEVSKSFQKNKNVHVATEPPTVFRSKKDDIRTVKFNLFDNTKTESNKLNDKINSEKGGKDNGTIENFLSTDKTQTIADAKYSKISTIKTDKGQNFKYAFNESVGKTSQSPAGNFNKLNDINYEVEAESDAKVDFTQKHAHPETLNEDIKEDEIKTAYDFVKNLRAKKKSSQSIIKDGRIVIPKECKRDSKGFRILENQVPDFTDCTNDEIVSLLRNSVLYADDNLVVLNKPYNLVIHESETTKDRCLSSLLEDLAKDLDPKNASSKLLTVHRLDKETTGCLLLARTEIMAQTLKSYFALRKIMKKYLIITSKVPEPLEGIIDIPIAEGFIERKSRMVLQPDIPSDIKYFNHCNKGKRAVTQYKVISSRHNAALVEVRPETGIKHQIRVHFGFGLSCPILGDHKYSHLRKLAPQKLQADILQKLYVRQSKVRYIPMHIHAHSIVIPDYFERRNLFVAAPLPEHMRRSMKALQLTK